MVTDEVSLYCPYCGKHTAVSPAPLAVSNPRTNHPSGHESLRDHLKGRIPFYAVGQDQWWLGKCNACQQPLLVKGRGALVYPAPQPGPVPEQVTDPMRSDLAVAKRCAAIGARNAAVVMARRALQSAAVEQGAPKGKKLWEQIADLAARHVITASLRQAADAARWVGNHGAHDTEPDIAAGKPVITTVTKADAEETLALVEHIFETLYVVPHFAKQQLSKRGKLRNDPRLRRPPAGASAARGEV